MRSKNIKYILREFIKLQDKIASSIEEYDEIYLTNDELITIETVKITAGEINKIEEETTLKLVDIVPVDWILIRVHFKAE